MELQKTITLTLDEADIDLPSLQRARSIAITKTLQRTGLYPNDWNVEIWDDYAMTLLLVYFASYGNNRFYGHLSAPVMRAQTHEQYVDGF